MFVRTFYGFVSWIKILFCIELKDRLSSFFFLPAVIALLLLVLLYLCSFMSFII